jgi:hypothetical protein
MAWPTIVDDDGSGTTGTVLDKALFDLIRAYIDRAWLTYTPFWITPAGDPFGIGNGTLTGRYLEVGAFIVAHIRLKWGSTTSGGGSFIFGLPPGKLLAGGGGDNQFPLVMGMAAKKAGAAYALSGGYPYTTTGINPFAGAVGSPGISVTHLVPFTFADGDIFEMWVLYETGP